MVAEPNIINNNKKKKTTTKKKKKKEQRRTTTTIATSYDGYGSGDNIYLQLSIIYSSAKLSYTSTFVY